MISFSCINDLLSDQTKGTRSLITWFLNLVMQLEAPQQVRAEAYDRTHTRTWHSSWTTVPRSIIGGGRIPTNSISPSTWSSIDARRCALPDRRLCRTVQPNRSARTIPHRVPRSLLEPVETFPTDRNRWLDFYTTQRPHRDYRNGGRQPIETPSRITKKVRYDR